MKRSSNLLQTVSSTNGQTIHGQLCLAACQVTPEWIRSPARKGLPSQTRSPQCLVRINPLPCFMPCD